MVILNSYVELPESIWKLMGTVNQCHVSVKLRHAPFRHDSGLSSKWFLPSPMFFFFKSLQQRDVKTSWRTLHFEEPMFWGPLDVMQKPCRQGSSQRSSRRHGVGVASPKRWLEEGMMDVSKSVWKGYYYARSFSNMLDPRLDGNLSPMTISQHFHDFEHHFFNPWFFFVQNDGNVLAPPFLPAGHGLWAEHHEPRAARAVHQHAEAPWILMDSLRDEEVLTSLRKCWSLLDNKQIASNEKRVTSYPQNW